MKKIILLSILGVLSVSLLSADGGIDFSGEVSTRWGAAAPWTDSDTAAGRFTIGDLSFTGSIDAYYDNSSALAEGTVSSRLSRAREKLQKELKGDDEP